MANFEYSCPNYNKKAKLALSTRRGWGARRAPPALETREAAPGACELDPDDLRLTTNIASATHGHEIVLSLLGRFTAAADSLQVAAVRKIRAEHNKKLKDRVSLVASGQCR